MTRLRAKARKGAGMAGMGAFLLGFTCGVVVAIGGLVLASRTLRRRRVLQQPVDAGARRDIPSAPGSPMTWRETQEWLAVLRWTPQQWKKRWPEA